MRTFRHLFRLLAEFWGFARENRAWWIIPIILILLLLIALVVIGSGVAPFIYPIF